ncbi:MAG: alcohol dehydrogenase catalytic domain-containing protein, partial [Chloroflexi bacterium]|nr:alcohol dehydrogenase catalytic domain-containing protein [Chloroflexota bacterium]
MRAILFHKHGGPEVLEYANFPAPQPKPGEALVRLRAAALNRVDVFVRNGWPSLKLELPHIPGADGAGEVAGLGEGATGFNIGDRIVINANLGCGECDACKAGQDNLCKNWHLLGETVRGTYCEFICVPIRQLHKVPDGFDLHQAAAAALVYQTAWHSMVARGQVKAGETVAIVGAGGGVNSASIQIEKYLGAKGIVIGSNAEKLKQAESLGADILIDRSKEEDWSKAVFLATNKQGVNVVV